MAPRPSRSTRTTARAIVRELKAVGGSLKLLRLALTGAERGPELWTVVAAVPRDEALRRAAAAITPLMAVRLYDTATRSLVALPDPPAEIGMYVCGPTVYQRAHIGNARPVRHLRLAAELAARARLRRSRTSTTSRT